MIRTGITLLAVAILAAHPAVAHAQVKKSDSVVKIEVDAGKIENEKQTVTLTFAIETGYHIYANKIGQENIALPTEVTISGKTKLQAVKVSYPPGKLEESSVVGDHYIYRRMAVIEADVQRAKGDTGPLKATIKLQACSEGKDASCLMPATVEVNIP
ncbi:MAG: disulfide bond corrector protein DsbC [Verrucomicrobiota bacterium]|jgi:thiol:disulfide interchange protein